MEKEEEEEVEGEAIATRHGDDDDDDDDGSVLVLLLLLNFPLLPRFGADEEEDTPRALRRCWWRQEETALATRGATAPRKRRRSIPTK